MEERKLLLFRQGIKTYGIPIENIAGIISNPWLRNSSIHAAPHKTITLQDKPIALLQVDTEFQVHDKKHAIIMHSNGIQTILLADEIINEITLKDGDTQPDDTTVAHFQIWRFQPPKDIS